MPTSGPVFYPYVAELRANSYSFHHGLHEKSPVHPNPAGSLE